MIDRAPRRPASLLLLALAGWSPIAPSPLAAQAGESPAAGGDGLARRVEIARTGFGVPHIRAADLEALGYGLAWVQMEDYGEEVLRRLLSSRGELARHLGDEHVDDDLAARPGYLEALATYHGFPPDTRAVMEGFAAGVNDYVRAHAGELPEWAPDDFSGHDVAARDVGSWSRSRARDVLEAMGLDDAMVPGVPPSEAEGLHPDDGSNSWALAPSRTASGAAILVRNPHLSWSAGYYEAHVVVPGRLDFYGDFRIGGAFGIIGGFNRHLGWSTTNNYPTLDQAYRLRLDPERPDHVRLDGAAVPLTAREVTVQVLRDDGTLSPVTRRFWRSPLGPVIHRDDSTVIVFKAATEDTPSRGEQFLRMMEATTLGEWKAAMRIRAMPSSNFTYADADGNILYVWNARLPSWPHAPADTALTVSSSGQVWTSLLPWDSLPRLENPPGGYVQNANDTPHFTNLNRVLALQALPVGTPEPRLRLRSQLSLRLVESMGDGLTLDDVIRRKHDLTMLAAERLLPNLLEAGDEAVREHRFPPGTNAAEVRAALEMLRSWDRTAAAEARGAVLFDRWMRQYVEAADTARLWKEPWNPDEPTRTPAGVGDPEAAVAALVRAIDEARERWGSWDVAWGEVHRARLGDLDLPAPGCDNLLGCFRVLGFVDADDGRREVYRGDGWIFAVEFTDPVRARTILAYGQTDDPERPHHADQLEMFLRGEMKPVGLGWPPDEGQIVRRYRPGG